MAQAGDGLPGIWRNANFVKFWAGMNISLLGSQVASLAYPLLAVITLQATPTQMGLIRATGLVASVLVGPFAGVFVDRLRRRPLLIATDLGLALVAASVPLAALLGLLRIEQLYVVQFLTGTLSIIGDVTLMSYVTTIVRRDQLVKANSQVQAGGAVITIVGPSLGGALVQWWGASLVIICDACSFIFSAITAWLIRAPEPAPAPADERRGIRAEIGEGLRVVYGHRLLRPLAEGIAAHFLFAGMVYTIFVLYAVRELKLAPAPLGLVMAALGPGFLVGALFAPRAALHFGVGRVLCFAPFLIWLGTLLIPLAGGSQTIIISMLMAAHFLMGCGIQLHGVNFLSLRQAVTPHALQGRMNASFRFVNLFASMVGSLASGLLAERIGLRATLALAACGLILPPLRLLFSPLRNLREQPAPIMD